MCLGKPNKLNEEFPPWQFCWWSFFGCWKGDPFQKLLRDLRVRDRKVTSSESPGLYCNRKLRGVAKTLIAVGEWSIDLFLVKGNRFWPSQIQCFGRTQYRTVCWVFLYIYNSLLRCFCMVGSLSRNNGLVQPPSHSKTLNPPQSDSPEGAFHVGTSWFVIVAPYVSWFNELVDYRNYPPWN